MVLTVNFSSESLLFSFVVSVRTRIDVCVVAFCASLLFSLYLINSAITIGVLFPMDVDIPVFLLGE